MIVFLAFVKENKYSKLTEEQKSEICNSIDCTKLSPSTLVDCVQNPKMPLRFIVRAILVEHLNTRRSITAAVIGTGAPQQQQEVVVERTSLGDILQHDMARRQAAQLREAMDSTYSRIQSLEKELRSMRKILHDHQAEDKEEEEEKEQRNVLNSSERSASFHFVPSDPVDQNSNRIQRGGRGSVSSSGFLFEKKNIDEMGKRYNGHYSGGSSCHDDGSSTPTKIGRGSFRHRFITGLKNAFRISNST